MKPKPKRGRPRDPNATGGEPKRFFRASDEIWQEYQRAAALAGVSVSELIRDATSKAAKKLLGSGSVQMSQRKPKLMARRQSEKAVMELLERASRNPLDKPVPTQGRRLPLNDGRQAAT